MRILLMSEIRISLFKLKVQLFLRIENVDKILQTICYQQKKRKRFVLSLLLCTLTVVEDTFARE